MTEVDFSLPISIVQLYSSGERIYHEAKLKEKTGFDNYIVAYKSADAKKDTWFTVVVDKYGRSIESKSSTWFIENESYDFIVVEAGPGRGDVTYVRNARGNSRMSQKDADSLVGQKSGRRVVNIRGI